ncbi:penicillin-binding protein (plasmid) [Arthrobacter sp. ERGS1:01]|uniref:serine hydrolase domain-containing protein n=1 Tax=Arthrobacter sp. ERGS1:01 TaxID=1704044 RepID=UPI0006B430B9|nr:serine hydrolase domain-containing protein [Arthrobacter sp. ERGS1:01]ALE04171.1 penicillin-binding protein [Arthrobacter sp. ERGS1:01]
MTVTIPPDLLTTPEWQERLDSLAKKHAVPGVQVGLIALDSAGDVDLRVLTTGVTSLVTGVEVTPETIFQYGSITKIWTTTLIMQLVDEGKLTLDTLVVDVLPDFKIATSEYSDLITVRHLLTHTSGIDGDLFTDTGYGDDCIEKYVASLSTASSITPPGGQLSYCNSGFTVAGRIIEVLRGKAWDDVLVDHLYAPLGLSHVITRTKDAPLFRAAVGHLANTDPTSEERVVPTKQWVLVRAQGPAGVITGTVEDLLIFASAHMRDGLGLNGNRILSEESARLMRTPQFDLSTVSSVDQAWGLGWVLSDWGQATSVRHSGATIGQIASLHTFPEANVAVCILTNSRGGSLLAKELETAIGAELGLAYPQPLDEGAGDEFDGSGLLGTYETTTTRFELTRREDGQLLMAASSKVDISGEPDQPPLQVRMLSNSRFMFDPEGSATEFAHLLIDGVEFLYGGRLYEKVSD